MKDIPCPEGLGLERIAWEQAEAWARDVIRRLEGRVQPELVAFERSYLGANLRLYHFYGAEFFAVTDAAGEPRALHVAKFNSSGRKNAWGRYVNHYLAFTDPDSRRQGYAVHGELRLQAIAAELGYDRLKTLCQSWLGVLYHEHLRDRMWGVNEKGEIVIDSPLHGGPWPAGVPIKARKHNATGRELDGDELAAVLSDQRGRFRAPAAAVRYVLEKRAWRRGLDSNQGGADEAAPTRPEAGRLQPLSHPPDGGTPS